MSTTTPFSTVPVCACRLVYGKWTGGIVLTVWCRPCKQSHACVRLHV